MSEAEQREIEEKYDLRNAPSRYSGSESICWSIGAIAGATAMAEKKNLEVKVWKNTADEFKKYNDELKQQAVFADEIQNQLQTRIEQDIAQFEAAQVEIEELKKENTRLHKGTIHQHNKIEVIQAELSRVKEVANIMQSALLHRSEKMTTEALTEFANLMNKEK